MKPLAKSRSKMFEQGNQIPTKKREFTAIKAVTGKGITDRKFKIATWNVNGIRNVIAKNALFNYIKAFKPEIICINETKIGYDQFQKSPIYVEGYNAYWNFCKISEGYSGVAILSKYFPISVFQDLEEKEHSQEGRVLTLEFQQFYLISVYVPCAGKQFQRLEYKCKKFEVSLFKHCQNLRKTKKAVILCGDLNTCVDKLDVHWTPNSRNQPGFSDPERASLQGFLRLGWIDTFRKQNPQRCQYTWWFHNGREKALNIGKRLDYFLINDESQDIVSKTYILSEVKGSDHCPVEIVLDLDKLYKEDKKIKENPIQQQNIKHKDQLDSNTIQQVNEEVEYNQNKLNQDPDNQETQPTQTKLKEDTYIKEDTQINQQTSSKLECVMENSQLNQKEITANSKMLSNHAEMQKNIAEVSSQEKQKMKYAEQDESQQKKGQQFIEEDANKSLQVQQ